MSRRRLGIGVLLAACLAMPTRSSADSLIDLIWEMSGPQMIGFLSECRIALDGSFEHCKVFEKKVVGPGARSTTKVWLSLQGGPFFSTGKNASGQDYKFFKVGMIAFDPMLEVQSVTRSNGFAMYHGVLGVSYNLLFGEGFDTFTNVAFKLRPIGLTFPLGGGWKFDLEYNVRLYPSGFSADEFGKVPVAPPLNRAETVQGVGLGLRF